MFIDRVSKQLLHAEAMAPLVRALRQGEDATLAVSQSGRALALASIWAWKPRPCLYVVSGEEAADRAARTLAAWVGLANTGRYRDRPDLPWSDKAADLAIIGERTRCIERLALGEPCIVVASARALLRRVPSKSEKYWQSVTYSVGDEVPIDQIAATLLGLGYANPGEVDGPGTFRVHGDLVDVYPAQATAPVRIELFGDEIDRIRRMVSSTGQSIGDLGSVELLPAREYALTEQAVKRARRALWEPAKDDTTVAADLEAIETGIPNPRTDLYLPQLYGKTGSPIDHLSKDTLVCLNEPRALFDDCLRATEDLSASAAAARATLEGLFTAPSALDFGTQQRLSLSSILIQGAKPTAELTVAQPQIAGSDQRMLGRVRQFVNDNLAVVFAVPDRGAREALELTFTDERVPFCESLANDPKNALPATDPTAWEQARPPHRGEVTFFDAPVPAGVVVPTAGLAVLSVADLSNRSAKRAKHRSVDITNVTFPFKPGDYVVHASHGVAKFTDIVRREVGGRERDYFLLEYAEGDKLYVPLEQVDRITRYVGAGGDAPRLTRLNTADWSRATTKARKNAKKMAFDLVDLYTRRAAVTGFAFSPDDAAQRDMEASFSYQLTDDQANAVADIKADMEQPKPMDRLLCGDVGFGKTEVALRAAFKAVEDGKQVMVLCPTTILAQQHYETFESRFAPFGVKVDVLSRFRTAKEQKEALKGFADGRVDVLIGTHRLLSADVNPKDLGLVIVDEEQRFGVQHKEQLKNLREQVDVLTLSATPIPRTLQMSLSGVRDMSLIMTPPAGRKPVKVTVAEYDPDVVSTAIRTEMARGGQVYYVSNRVKTIDEAVEHVREAAPEARVGVAHGQMSAREVEDVMMRFQEHEIDVLVATTIIESGIDNPHTNTLVIEDSQRLGLAQLYQLKGRVGRGKLQAYAYFLFPGDKPLTEEATERLTAINEYQELGSGMRVAMRDLEIRGAGSLVGAEQHGNLSSVGFDLFTQMLGNAVAEARGEVGEVAPPEVTINLQADFFFDDEYLPDIDKRVLAYRRLAAATELADVERLENELAEKYGELPAPARNLVDRARLRIRAERLGVTSVALTGGRLVYQGLDVPRDLLPAFKKKGALVYPKTHKVAYPFHKGEEDVVVAALGVLEDIGGAGDDEEPDYELPA
ncbi:transcription-repair coupling factor [Olsenella sp. YH-ols2217]|uniref:Transcription-repair-coupling factor n=1 Tax=Kribbibacterium absianum TaxID=3044210 RepID=A0ABT6ZM65_9ACTN|nr:MULTISPECIES: transcription-repair coupling factor [unclassified Olsenella]MDJ1121738.1 transcription-repair coupling factor [Olsenella sp. YH-ols2216]MDJ1129746.1 transcription-repair coupling factor [Olsenella sp. YH-ols2217]